jgi:hypothetical protein
VEKLTGQELRAQPIDGNVLLNLRLLQSLNQTRLLVVQRTYQLGLLQLPPLLSLQSSRELRIRICHLLDFLVQRNNIRPCSTDVVGGDGENRKDEVTGSCLIASDAEPLMNVHALTLADESSTIRSEVDYLLLADLPDSFVDCFDIVRDSRDVLDGSLVGDDYVLHVVIP